MTRRLLLIGVVVLALVLGFALPATALAADFTAAPADYTPTATTEKTGLADCLLIQDIAPWGVDANVQALTASGIPFDVANSSSLATWDLSEYRFILYADDQPQSYYDNLDANIAKIEDFVSDGGLLIAQMCAPAWETGDFRSLHILPGNVSATFDVVFDVYVQDAGHPLMSGIDAAYLWLAGGVARGTLLNLPAGAHGIVSSDDVASMGEPVYAEYDFGNGKVVATTYISEWFWGHEDRPLVLENMIAYGHEWWITVESDCFTEQAIDIPIEMAFTVGHKLKVSVSDVSVLLGEKLLPGDEGQGAFTFTVWSNDDVECRMTNSDFTGNDLGVNDEGAGTLTYPDGVTASDWDDTQKCDHDEGAPHTITGDRLSIELNGSPYNKGDWHLVNDGPTGDAGVQCDVDLALDPISYADHAGYYTGMLILDVRQF